MKMIFFMNLYHFQNLDITSCSSGCLKSTSWGPWTCWSWTWWGGACCPSHSHPRGLIYGSLNSALKIRPKTCIITFISLTLFSLKTWSSSWPWSWRGSACSASQRRPRVTILVSLNSALKIGPKTCSITL